AAALALAAAAVLWVFSRQESPRPPQQTVTTAAPPSNPVAAQLSAAQAALDAGQYAAALSAADVVLAQAPQHPDARRVRDAARRGGGRCRGACGIRTQPGGSCAARWRPVVQRQELHRCRLPLLRGGRAVSERGDRGKGRCVDAGRPAATGIRTVSGRSASGRG